MGRRERPVAENHRGIPRVPSSDVISESYLEPKHVREQERAFQGEEEHRSCVKG